jgi:hypothetical protein
MLGLNSLEKHRVLELTLNMIVKNHCITKKKTIGAEVTRLFFEEVNTLLILCKTFIAFDKLFLLASLSCTFFFCFLEFFIAEMFIHCLEIYLDLLSIPIKG